MDMQVFQQNRQRLSDWTSGARRLVGTYLRYATKLAELSFVAFVRGTLTRAPAILQRPSHSANAKRRVSTTASADHACQVTSNALLATFQDTASWQCDDP